MLATILSPILSEINDKSNHKIAEELTGISERTWRDGGPKSKAKQEKIPSLIKESLKNRLENNTSLSKEEVTDALDRLADDHRGFLSSLITSFGKLQGFGWPITEKLALDLDAQNKELTNLIQRQDFHAFKQRIIELCSAKPLKLWINSIPGAVSLLENSAYAEDMKALDEITGYWAIHAIYTILACWDLEFQTKYLHPEGSTHNIEIRPLFHLLMPRTKPQSRSDSIEELSPKGILHLPMRRLLEMSYCLACFCRNRKFPKIARVRTCDVEAWAGESKKMQGKGNIEKIYSGTMGVTASAYDDIWVSMCGKRITGEYPLAPWPIYIAAQIWTHLYVTKKNSNGSKTANAIVTPGAGTYEYWWYHHRQKIEIGTQNNKVAAWPKCLISKEASETDIRNLSPA